MKDASRTFISEQRRAQPISILVWMDIKTPPAHANLVLLAFRADGVIGVQIARYNARHGEWYAASGEWIERPIAYAELTIPPELAEVTP